MAAVVEQLVCDDEARRAALRARDDLHGIDYVEVVTEPAADNQRVLRVIFQSKATAAGRADLLVVLNALAAALDRFTILGGVRVRNIQVLAVTRVRDDMLELRVSGPGDFSFYTLQIDDLRLDPAYRRVVFSFKAGCPSRFDCRVRQECPPEPRTEPTIDYLAKDYASFRQALLDLIPTLVPHWRERSESDLGTALIELLAYAGDHLSYYQDAVANEAFLETARQRISVRRHARLIDYRMHDGTSARTFVHFRVDAAAQVPAGVVEVLTRVHVPLGPALPPHGPLLPEAFRDRALDSAAAVFETMTDGWLHPLLNEIRVHTWGNRECCLPRGTTSLDLAGDLTAVLQRGDFLLVEEVLGPATGLAADADPAHRQVVRLVEVDRTEDPLLPDPVTGAPPLVLTRVSWPREDRLTFPLCLSIRLSDGTRRDNVSVARGNLALADHGRTYPDEPHEGPPAEPEACLRRAHRTLLDRGPLSFRIGAPRNTPPWTPVADLLRTNPAEALPQVTLAITPPGGAASTWTPVPLTSTDRADLLDSGPFDPYFAVETDNSGRALLRFGLNAYGQAPADGAAILATYRVGVGVAGNVGAESLAHVVRKVPPAAAPPGLAAALNAITVVRNPLAAWGGVEPESIDQIKLLAPPAFHAEQFRAVTEEDYARAAERHPEVSRAVATFRWTGSWHTVFVTIDPRDRSDLPPALRQSIHDWVARFTQAGYDLEIAAPIYVPLDIEVDVCVKRHHFAAHVEAVLVRKFSSQMLPDGTPGFFHADRFTFAQPLYLSELYAAIDEVEGVDSAVVTKFQRFGRVPNHEIQNGLIHMDRLEVLRLDNDPSFPEHGVLRFRMVSGT